MAVSSKRNSLLPKQQQVQLVKQLLEGRQSTWPAFFAGATLSSSSSLSLGGSMPAVALCVPAFTIISSQCKEDFKGRLPMLLMSPVPSAKPQAGVRK